MIYVLSDIHGNRAAFDSVLSQIRLQEEDTLYVLGDVIDRHPYGVELLLRIMEMPNAKMLLGNHEYMMMRALGFPYDGPRDIAGEDPDYLRELWYYNGGRVTHYAWNRTPELLQERLRRYLKRLPLNFDLSVGGKLYKLVHAAPEELYDPARDRDGRTFFCVWERDAVMAVADLEATITIFGHTPTAYFQNRNPLEVFFHHRLIGIDCGAGWPPPDRKNRVQGRLACLRLDDWKVFYSE